MIQQRLKEVQERYGHKDQGELTIKIDGTTIATKEDREAKWTKVNDTTPAMDKSDIYIHWHPEEITPVINRYRESA